MKQLGKMKALYETPEVKSWMAVYTAYKAMISPLESAMAKQGCSTPRLQILFSLYFDGEKQQAELAKKMKVSRANISTFIKRLLEDRLIEPTPPESKRPSYKLTSKGILDFESFFEDHIGHIKTLIEPINPACINSLQKLADQAETNATKIEI